MTRNPTIKLVAFDMEGCLTADPTVWEIMHRKVGTWETHGQRYWDEYRAGKFEYDTFARMDVAAWKDTPYPVLQSAASEVAFMPGCEMLLRALGSAGIQTAILSCGLTDVAHRFRPLGVGHIIANSVLEKDGVLTGELDIILPYEQKGVAMESIAREYGLSRDEIAAVGDSRSDIAMFERAGVSVAFCAAHPSVEHAATHVVRRSDLHELTQIFDL